MPQSALEDLVEEASRQLPAEGMAVAVSLGSNSALLCRGEVAGLPVSSSTVMYAASLTKQLMGALTALAVIEDRLSPETPLVDLVTGLPPWLGNVAIRHLLQHTSGVLEVTATAEGNGPADNSQVLERLARLTTADVTPGERYAYSNTGYVLLAEAVESAFGIPLAILAQQRMFEPLGMTDSRLGGPAYPVQCPDPPGTVGDGGWWVSIQDLARWLDALNRGVLGHEVTAMMEQPGRLNDGTPLDYAWGVRVRPHRAGRLITHGGTWPGWLSKTVRIPEAGIAVAVLCHGADESATSNLGLALAEHLVPLVVARR